jgi:transposase
MAMLYKRLDQGRLQWPKNEQQVRNLSQQELRWLLVIYIAAKGDYEIFKRHLLIHLYKMV